MDALVVVLYWKLIILFRINEKLLGISEIESRIYIFKDLFVGNIEY